MNELDLREHLAVAAERVPHPELVPGVWRRGRRRHRLVAAASVVGTMAVTAAVVLGVTSAWPEAPVPDVVATPTPSPTPTSGDLLPPDPRLGEFYDTVLSLPFVSSRDSAPTYVLDGQAWYGKVQRITAGARGTVTADDVVVGSRVGWVGQVRRPDVVAGTFGPLGGEFEPLPYQDPSNPDVFAASLDGRYIAMGRSLLNGDGERIGSLPADVASTQAWTPAGLVYSDAAGGAWLWNPGQQPTALPSTYNVHADGWGIVREDSCWSVYRLRRGQTSATEEFRHCGAYPVVSLSPAWFAGPRLVLTADGRVLETAGGREVQRLDFPPFLMQLREQLHIEYGGWWRGNVAEPRRAPPKVYVSFTVDLRQAGTMDAPARYRAFILECKVATGECGRLRTSYSDTPGVPFVWRP